MARIPGPYRVYRRRNSFSLILYPASGLSAEICQKWYRKSFKGFPQALATFRDPKSRGAAQNGAQALIDYLKSPGNPKIIIEESGRSIDITHDITMGDWIQQFTVMSNPHADRLVVKGAPYSPDTIEGYEVLYRCHIKMDPALKIEMSGIKQEDILGMLGRIARHKNQFDKILAGTRTYIAVYKFIRMTFKECQKNTPNGLIRSYPLIPPGKNPK